MSESNFCTICGQRWNDHSWERCDEIARRLESEVEPDDVDITGFDDRLHDGFQMMSGFDDP